LRSWAAMWANESSSAFDLASSLFSRASCSARARRKVPRVDRRRPAASRSTSVQGWQWRLHGFGPRLERAAGQEPLGALGRDGRLVGDAAPGDRAEPLVPEPQHVVALDSGEGGRQHAAGPAPTGRHQLVDGVHRQHDILPGHQALHQLLDHLRLGHRAPGRDHAVDPHRHPVGAAQPLERLGLPQQALGQGRGCGDRVDTRTSAASTLACRSASTALSRAPMRLETVSPISSHSARWTADRPGTTVVMAGQEAP
jgi:hypothetical protein